MIWLALGDHQRVETKNDHSQSESIKIRRMIWLAFGKPSTREGEQLELRLVDWLHFGVNLHDVIYNSDYLQIDKWKQYQKI